MDNFFKILKRRIAKLQNDSRNTIEKFFNGTSKFGMLVKPFYSKIFIK